MSETENLETKQIEPENIPESDDKKTLEVDTADMPDSSGNPPDDGPGVVRKAMEKLGIIKGKEPKPEDTEGNEIPDEFTDAALIYGMTEDEITEFASDYTDDELKEMIPFLLEDEEKLEPEEKPSAKDEKNPNSQQTNLPKEEIEALKEEVRKEFRGEIDALKEKLGVHENQVMMDTVNQAFDEAGKEFEVFGQTDKLPVFPAGPKKGQYILTSPQMKARSEVYEKAEAFIKNGVSIKDAMQDALTWYRGKYLTVDVKKNLIKDLKKNEKKLSAKRTSKETVPTYEDEEERQIAFVKQQAEKLGIKLSEE